MITLGIETSEGLCSCALLENEKIIEEINLKTQSQQENLILSIEKLFKNSGKKKSGISLICVDIGPGAFTSLRIGVTTAKALSHAFNVPITGVTSFEALLAISEELVPGEYDRVVLINSLRKKVFAAIFLNKGKEYNNLDLSIEDVLYYLRESKNVVFVGSGAEEYKQIIENKFIVKPHFIDSQAICLKGSLIAKIGYKKFNDGFVTNVHKLIPLYVRNSDSVISGK